MNEAVITNWAAWSPGLTNRDEWVRWAQNPTALGRSGAPEVEFLPAMQRRRCDALSRMCFQVIHEVCPPEGLGDLTSVFASRHGSFGNMTALLFALADGRALSPNGFSHSVHNTQAGLFSIWAQNRAASTCVAGGAETFGAGLLEALGSLTSDPERTVLLVVADEAVPEPFDSLCDDKGAYAVALLLRSPESLSAGTALSVQLERGEVGTSRFPDAVTFIRWLMGTERLLRLCHARRTWVLERP